ncbi:hypothetical protein M8542_42560 [Amycolatopsis sp. OK19-0408]|uniref:Uncharacterized protein n=1 Tax=Amycolatopsis iheyensis TaxID=2945988 RepID=A0A9X2SR54_9PSEU|nr:hypothetical protein [Amycolatopsis iheyensis]MCR6489520.1 hypothetical protein [Amycolatopsis iheyensis]
MLSGCTAEAPPPSPSATSTPPTAPPTLPEGLTGVPATGGIGITALIPTTGPTLFDADGGPVATPPGYPGGDLGISVVRVGTHAVLTAYPTGAGSDDPFEVFAYTGPASPPRSLGRAWSVAPAVDGESVWVIRQDAPDTCRLQRVSLAGGELGHGQSASCRTQVRAGTPHGLLITINSGVAESTDALIDPETGRTVQQAPRILGVAGDRMLLDGLTEFTLVDLRNNSRRQLSRPVVARTPTVVPSRDGGIWAVDFANPAYRGTSTQTRDLWLLRLAGPDWEHVAAMPFVTEHLKRGGGFDWSEDGDLVLADGVLAAWHPGEPAWRLGKAALPKSSWSGFAVLP